MRIASESACPNPAHSPPRLESGLLGPCMVTSGALSRYPSPLRWSKQGSPLYIIVTIGRCSGLKPEQGQAEEIDSLSMHARTA